MFSFGMQLCDCIFKVVMPAHSDAKATSTTRMISPFAGTDSTGFFRVNNLFSELAQFSCQIAWQHLTEALYSLLSDESELTRYAAPVLSLFVPVFALCL